jgi:hypothetical protein
MGIAFPRPAENTQVIDSTIRLMSTIRRVGGFAAQKLVQVQSESKLVPYLLDDPGEEDDRRPDLDGVGLNLVKKSVRIKSAALHAISFPAEPRDLYNRRIFRVCVNYKACLSRGRHSVEISPPRSAVYSVSQTFISPTSRLLSPFYDIPDTLKRCYRGGREGAERDVELSEMLQGVYGSNQM